MKMINESGIVVTGDPGSREVAEALVSKLEEVWARKAIVLRKTLGNPTMPGTSGFFGFIEDESTELLNVVAGQQDGIQLYFGRKPNTNDYGFWPIASVEV